MEGIRLKMVHTAVIQVYNHIYIYIYIYIYIETKQNYNLH